VLNVGVAGHAQLAAMRHLCHFVGFFDNLEVSRRQMLGGNFQQAIKTCASYLGFHHEDQV
jgi:hypothetical protein